MKKLNLTAKEKRQRARAASKKWYEKNKDRAREYNRLYSARNRVRKHPRVFLQLKKSDKDIFDADVLGTRTPQPPTLSKKKARELDQKKRYAALLRKIKEK